MALIVVGSVSGSPGVTTTALGLTMAWPRPAMLIEAEITKTSSTLPGMLKGQIGRDHGLTQIAVASDRGPLELDMIWEQAIEFAREKYLVPGFENIAGASGTSSSFWGRVTTALLGMESGGSDVIVDVGRIAFNDPRIPLLQQADLIALVARPVLPDVAAISSRLPDLRRVLQSVDHEDHLGLVLLDSTIEPYSNSEIGKILGLPVIDRLPWDPITAAVHSQGMNGSKRTFTSALNKAVTALPHAIDQLITSRRELLGVQPRIGDES